MSANKPFNKTTLKQDKKCPLLSIISYSNFWATFIVIWGGFYDVGDFFMINVQRQFKYTCLRVN